MCVLFPALTSLRIRNETNDLCCSRARKCAQTPTDLLDLDGFQIVAKQLSTRCLYRMNVKATWISHVRVDTCFRFLCPWKSFIVVVRRQLHASDARRILRSHPPPPLPLPLHHLFISSICLFVFSMPQGNRRNYSFGTLLAIQLLLLRFTCIKFVNLIEKRLMNTFI